MTNNQPKLRAIKYCRVSSKEQELGYSLDAQEKLQTEYSKGKFIVVGQAYRIAESASGKQIRKKFNEMMMFVKKNNIKVILCEKIDRLTRNPKDAVAIYDWLQEDEERAVHCVKENFIANRNTKAHENLVWDMKVAIAKFYSQNLSEEVKKGQKEMLSQGRFPTRPPMGYRTIEENGHKAHVIDEETAPFMRRMFELYATGNYSIIRLEKEFYDEGLRTKSGKRLRKSKIHTMLQNPFFYGGMLWMGVTYPNGRHEALINKDLFDKVQLILKRKIKNPKYQKHNSLFKSKIVCDGCGGTVTWYEKKGHWYGHCNNSDAFKHCPKKTGLREDRVEPQLTGIFDVIAAKDERVLAAIENILRSQHSERITKRETELKRLQGLLQSTRAQKDRLYEAKLSREIEDIGFFNRKLAELTTEEESLENALVAVGNENDLSLQIGVAVHELAYKSHEIYQNASVDAKRLLFSQLFTNLLQDGLEIRKEYTKAAAMLMEWVPKLNKDYELAKSQVIKGKEAVSVASQPNWLPDLDSNQDTLLQRE